MPDPCPYHEFPLNLNSLQNDGGDGGGSVRGLAKRMRIVAGQQFLDRKDAEEIIFDVDSVVLHPRW